MTDGSTAVSLVLSHCLADGFGALLTIIDAVKGNRRDLGYPPPRSRTRFARCAGRPEGNRAGRTRGCADSRRRGETGISSSA